MLKAHIAVKALIKKDDSYLILKNIASGQNDEFSGWETPGGRLEEGEELLSGLGREIKEETGLEVSILFPFHTHSANVGQDNHIIGITYLATYIDGDVRIDNREHSKYKWETIEKIRELKNSIGLQKEIDAYESFLFKSRLFIQ